MPTYIDLFAGCGGLSLGLKQAGWKGLFAIEKNPDAFETLAHNLIESAPSEAHAYDWPAWLPKQNMSLEDLLSIYPEQLAQLRGQVDMIAGGPPCQGFSWIGRRDSRDPRNFLFRQYLEVVRLISPAIVLLENVRGIMSAFLHEGDSSAGQGAFSEQIRSGLGDIGYRTAPTMLCASDYGVPQQRARFFLVGVREDFVEEERVDPLERMPELLDERREYFLARYRLGTDAKIGVGEAISDLATKDARLRDSEGYAGFKEIVYEGPRTLYQRQMRSLIMDDRPPNSLRLPNHRAGTVEKFRDMLATYPRGRPLNAQERKTRDVRKQQQIVLDSGSPSPAITTLPDDSIHYDEPRILTVRELARLQSFPDWFAFRGQYTTGGQARKDSCPRYTQVGNAVPPRLAEHVGVVLLHYLRRARLPTEGKWLAAAG